MLKSFQIKGVLTDSKELVKTIDADQKKRQEVEDSIGNVSSFFNSNHPSTKNLENENGDFIWFQLFIESILRMSSEALLPSQRLPLNAERKHRCGKQANREVSLFLREIQEH